MFREFGIVLPLASAITAYSYIEVLKGGLLRVDLVVALGEPERGTAQSCDYIFLIILSSLA